MDEATTEKPEIRITSANLKDWKSVEELRQDVTLNIGRVVKLNMRPISHAEFEKIRENTPEPEVKPGDAESEMKAAMVTFNRWVSAVDLCVIPFPGETLDEKARWAQNNWNPLKLKGVYLDLLQLSGFGAMEMRDGAIGEIKTAEDLAALTLSPHEAVFAGKDGDLIFRVHGVSGATAKAIDEATDPGPVPMEEPRGMKKGFNGALVPNPNDPKYRKRVADKNKERNILLLEAALQFSLGSTLADKIEFLSTKPAGQVLALTVHVRDEAVSYRGRTDFM